VKSGSNFCGAAGRLRAPQAFCARDGSGMAIGLEFRVALEGFGFGMGFHANLKHEGAWMFPFAVERSVALKTQ